MDRELIAYFDRHFDGLRENLLGAFEERFDKIDQRFDEVDGRLGRLEEETHGTRILVEDLQGKTELLSGGIANVDQKVERLHAEAMREIREVRSLVEVTVPPVFRRLDAVEKRVDVLEEGA